MDQSLPAAGFNGIPVALLAANHPIGVIFTGMFMSMSKTDMLGYWKRIFSSGFVPGQASHDDQAPQSAAQ